jgi:hypothetical protein
LVKPDLGVRPFDPMETVPDLAHVPTGRYLPGGEGFRQFVISASSSASKDYQKLKWPPWDKRRPVKPFDRKDGAVNTDNQSLSDIAQVRKSTPARCSARDELRAMLPRLDAAIAAGAVSTSFMVGQSEPVS